MLCQMHGTQTELAQKFGVGRRTWIRWCNGESVPGAKERARVHEEGGPPPEAWDEIPAPGSPVQLGKPLPELGALVPATIESARELAARLHRMAEQEMRALEEDTGEIDAKQRLLRMKALGGIVIDLGELTGAAGIDEKRIVASPAWARLWDRMCNALEPYPDAMRAAADALLGAQP